MKHFIAERKLIARSFRTSEQRLVHVRVGIPCWSDAEVDAACSRQWAGLFEDVADARGVDPIHALQIAVDVDSMINALKDKYEFHLHPGELPDRRTPDAAVLAKKRWIAERRLIAESRTTGDRKKLTIRVGIPFWRPVDEFASCPVEWSGLLDHVPDAKGVDRMQALQLACDINPMLEHLRTTYTFYWASGENYFDKE